MISSLNLCRFDQLQSLGKRVASNASTKNNEDLVQERMRQLTQDREALREAWEKRSKQLKQCSELQQFLRDAEQVDSATGAQEAFLSNDDLGVNWKDVCYNASLEVGKILEAS